MIRQWEVGTGESRLEFWVDEGWNRWDRRFFTKEQAETASESLNGCLSCLNCHDMELCRRCSDCAHMKGCGDCMSCTCMSDCRTCVLCADCESCVAMYGCERCSHMEGEVNMKN